MSVRPRTCGYTCSVTPSVGYGMALILMDIDESSLGVSERLCEERENDMEGGEAWRG